VRQSGQCPAEFPKWTTFSSAVVVLEDRLILTHQLVVAAVDE
jgi:hypothetical protein